MLMPILPLGVPVLFNTAFSHTLTSELAIASNTTVLSKVFPSALGGRTGTWIKPIVSPPDDGSVMEILAAAIGFPSGSTSSAIGYDGNQKLLTWDGGQSGGTFTLGQPQPEPDPIAFSIPDASKAIILAVDLAGGGGRKFSFKSGLSTSAFRAWTKSGVSEADDTTKSSYTAFGTTSGRLAVVGQLLIGN